MKHRKTFHLTAGVTVLGLALCVPTALLAQNATPDSSAPPPPPPNSQSEMGMRHHGPPSPERQLKHLTKTLNLTSDQQQQILPILQDRQTQVEAIHNNSSLSPQQRRQQMHRAMKDANQKLEAVMTDTQKQQFEQQMQERRDQMRERRMGQGAGSAPSSTENPPPPPPPPPPPQM